MSDFIFIFDLDSVITKEEVLPKLSLEIGRECEIKELTESTMVGNIPFKESFLERVEILKEIPLEKARHIVKNIQLNPEIVQFIQENRERCYIVTGNLDVWICDLVKDLNMEGRVYSSHGDCVDGYISQVVSVADKKLIVAQFVSRFVAIGDGNNDAEMIASADIGIGFGGVRPISSSVLKSADYAFYEEVKLCQFLKQLL